MAKVSKLNNWDVLILFLSLFSIIALVVDILLKTNPGIGRILKVFDFAVCFIFLIDFFWRLVRADNKLQFLKLGWIDLISSIPTLEIFRVGRLLRVFRIIRLLRAFKSARHLVMHLYQNRAQGALFTTAMISFVLTVTGAISVYEFEPKASGNILTPEDAVWWAIVTVTTVGYGDFYPISLGGRITAIFLMVSGIGFFGAFTGYVASMFGEKEEKEETDEKHGEIMSKLELIQNELKEIKNAKIQKDN